MFRPLPLGKETCKLPFRNMGGILMAKREEVCKCCPEGRGLCSMGPKKDFMLKHSRDKGTKKADGLERPLH